MNRLVCFVLLGAASCFGQSASLTGRITDQSGSVVPQASIAVQSTESGASFTTLTNAEGYYSLPSLTPGPYTVTITKNGFQTVKQTDLVLAVQQAARIDVALQIGAVTETVQVTAQAVLLESESTTVGQVIGSRQITELPLLGRNPYALAMLVPGVRPSFGVNNLPIDQISTVSFSINGQRASANEYLLDGAPNSAPSQNQPVINANPDTVQEFKVETNTFSAEYGRAAGGIFNVVTRSGGNDLHFSLYEFLRNEKLNANDWFANRAGLERPPLKFNQFGGTIGGPVVKNRTFFFGSVELVRFVQGITFTGTVPTPQQLAGDFSGARNAQNNPVIIYDPRTTRASGTGFIRDPFPANRIPADRIDPIARNIARYWPAPNLAGDPRTGVNNFTSTSGNRVDKDTFSVRLDHAFTESNRIFGRYSYDDTPFIRGRPYGWDNIASPAAGPQIFTRQNAVIEDSHVFSPTLLATVRASSTVLKNRREPLSSGFDITQLGFPSAFALQRGEPISFPAIVVTGYGVTGSIPNIVVGGALGATDLIRLGNDSHALQGNLTKNLTKHTLKFGGEYRIIHFNNQQTGDQSTNFTFTPQWTQGPNPAQSSATAGLGLATFLTGVATGSVSPAAALAQTTLYWGIFIQDTWKLTPRLTLNLGLRYDYESPRTDRFNQLSNFDYTAPSPLQPPGLNVRGGLTFVNVGGLPRGNTDPDRNNVAPRVGIAYRLTPQTVIRAGGGLFYAPTTGIGTGSGGFGISGFQASTNMVTSLDGVTPIVSLSNPYPNGLNQPSGSSQGLATLLGQAVSFFDRGNVTPYSAQWNFNIQRELPASVLLEIGYAGSRGLNFSQDRQWNQLPDSALSLGDALRQQVPNPFFGSIQVGTLAQRTVARAQLLRPFPQFEAVTSNSATWASSSFHALQAKAEKRYAKGLSLLAAYTYSKLMDYGIGAFAGEALGGSTIQNWNDLASEWSSSITDQTHRIIVNGVYELPFFARNSGVLGKALGGWQISAIWSAFSGGPLGMNSAVNNTFSQGSGQRPNWTGVSAKLDAPTPARWFDTDQFTAPRAYAFGNVARTLNGLRSDSTGQVDFTLSKNTKIRERWTLQFRTEFFNISNGIRFAPPNQVQGNPQFGSVSAQGNAPRVIQFGLKLIG